MTDPVERARKAVDALPGGEGEAAPKPDRAVSGRERSHTKLRAYVGGADRYFCCIDACTLRATHVHVERGLAAWCQSHRPSSRLHDGANAARVRCADDGCADEARWWHKLAEPSPPGYCDRHVNELEWLIDDRANR